MIILIAGPIAVGKSAVANELAAQRPTTLIRAREALAAVLGIGPDDRQRLQALGADLDARTAGRWMRDYIQEQHEPGTSLVVDSLRTRLQTIPVLDSLVDSRLVYLQAHEETRRARYATASAHDPVKASVPYDTAMHHPTETGVGELVPLAHLVVETDDLDVAEVAGVVTKSLLAWRDA